MLPTGHWICSFVCHFNSTESIQFFSRFGALNLSYTYFSENPAPSGIRNRTAGSDIGRVPRSSHCAMSLSIGQLSDFLTFYKCYCRVKERHSESHYINSNFSNVQYSFVMAFRLLLENSLYKNRTIIDREMNTRLGPQVNSVFR